MHGVGRGIPNRDTELVFLGCFRSYKVCCQSIPEVVRDDDDDGVLLVLDDEDNFVSFDFWGPCDFVLLDLVEDVPVEDFVCNQGNVTLFTYSTTGDAFSEIWN